MSGPMKRAIALVAAAALLAPPPAIHAADGGRIRNVILFVGDGMGLEHVKAGGLFVNGAPGTLVFESFPHHALMGTDNAAGGLTDSAASATAMATGVKVSNSVISKRIPGDGAEVETVLEIYKARGKRTGLVTNSDFVDATPAAFGAHTSNRNNKGSIFTDYATASRPNVLFGAYTVVTPATATAAGYPVVTTKSELAALDPDAVEEIAGLFRNDSLLQYEVLRAVGFGPNQPSLTQMTRTAIDILDNDPDGFFLLVENEAIDEIGHGGAANGRSRMETLVWEMKSLNSAVQAALSWAEGRDDTLIIVTADHETGDLTVDDASVAPGTVPAGTFAGTAHTRKPVGVWAWGPGASQVALVSENNHLHALLLPSVPEITLQPADRTTRPGESASFSAAAAGTVPLSYQWQRNGVDIAGATAASLTLPAATAADGGAVFRCRVVNPLGETTTREAILTVESAPAGDARVQAGGRGFLDLRTGGRAEVHFESQGEGGMELDIHAMSGERIREIRGQTTGGAQSIGWDGRDDSGRLVAPGVYLFRLAVPGLAQTGKIIALD